MTSPSALSPTLSALPLHSSHYFAGLYSLPLEVLAETTAKSEGCANPFGNLYSTFSGYSSFSCYNNAYVLPHTLILPRAAVVGALLGQPEGRVRYAYLARNVGEAVYDKMRHNKLCGQLVEADRLRHKGLLELREAQRGQMEGPEGQPGNTKKKKQAKADLDTAGTSRDASLLEPERDYQQRLEKVGPSNLSLPGTPSQESLPCLDFPSGN